MKLNLLRYHHIEGRRESDKGAEVIWNVTEDDNGLVIVTENGTKYKLTILIGEVITERRTNAEPTHN